jgi:uncharacterized membrane protein
MGVLLALGSAACYGLADFFGGVLSRRAHFLAIALAGQLGGLIVALAISPIAVSPDLTAADMAWGSLSGVGTGLGMVFLYRGLSRGTMSVVVPVSAVGAMALPVLVGVMLLGDRPSGMAWSGIGCAAPAIWLVARGGNRASVADRPNAAMDGVLASAGIALQYLALAQVSVGAGLWPIAAGRVTASLAVLPMIRPMGASVRLTPRLGLAAAANGTVAALALVSYLLAIRHELVSIVVVLSSLYPVIPVVLGITALRERLNPRQLVGLGGSAASIGLLIGG